MAGRFQVPAWLLAMSPQEREAYFATAARVRPTDGRAGRGFKARRDLVSVDAALEAARAAAGQLRAAEEAAAVSRAALDAAVVRALELGASTTEAARAAGLSRTTVSKIAGGRR